ncbi:MAG: membrane-associated phospholipid phosphatase [Phycisphaerales bacterium]|jgi:membrane-associated phospholipid phosphatase
MPDPTDHPEPRLTRRKFAVLAAAFIAAFVVLTLLDRQITHACFFPDTRDDWWRVAIKAVGDLRLWLVVGVLAFIIVRDWRWPAALVGAAALAGGLAELGKLLFGRYRPSANFELVNDGHYTFRPLFADFTADFFSATNLGFPSSHAATAFGGATMLGILIHRKSPALVRVAFILAAACAASRVFTGAHFATDVLAGAFVGYLAAHTLALVSDTMSGPRPTTP